LDEFVTVCLEQVQADDGKVAACDALRQILETFRVRPPEWRRKLVATVARRRQPLLVHGRARWEQVKAGTVEL
jgi:hypothetical protein